VRDRYGVLVAQRIGLRLDLVVGGAALVFVGIATAVGLFVPNIFAGAPPLFAEWLPHVGIGTPLAVLVAVAVIAWRPPLRLAYPLAVAWTFSLALIDGWQRGIADRLTSRDEYLHEVPGVTDIAAMLRSFSGRILDFQPDSWTTHVAGHPPGALLLFVWLDRLGLGGGAWGGVAVVLIGSLTAFAVPWTIRSLAHVDLAVTPRLPRWLAPAAAPGSPRSGPGAMSIHSLDRRGTAPWLFRSLGRPSTDYAELASAAIPFSILLPGAVWVGVSADGLFAGVTALAVGLLVQRHWIAWVGGGLLLGYSLFLSYGLLLFGLVALAAVVVTRRWAALIVAVVAALAVVVAFAAAGFWWFDGYHLVVERYYQGIGALRPYSYWVWADLAALVLAAGPAVVAGLRRLPGSPLLLITGAAVLAILLADVTGLSKAEVERIWLPFTVWLAPAAALLPAPTRRWWLAAQALTALAVNHLVLTNW
jgi:methylthioxylose transferase